MITFFCERYMTVELIIFDCDGVLVDSEPLANEQLRLALKECGLYMTIEQVVACFVGLSMPSVVATVEQKLGTKLPTDFLDRLQEKTFAAFNKSLKSVAGIEDVLRILSEREQKFCVASSGSFEKMEVTLSLTGLKIFFCGAIFSSSQVKKGKPSPDLYLYTAQQMGIRPEHCLVIEDSLPGVTGAVAAGMEVLAYSVRGECQALQSAGGNIITHPREILNYLS